MRLRRTLSVISRVEADPAYRAAYDQNVGFRYLGDRATATDAITLAARQATGHLPLPTLDWRDPNASATVRARMCSAFPPHFNVDN